MQVFNLFLNLLPQFSTGPSSKVHYTVHLCKIHPVPLSSNTAKFGELPLHIHLISCFPSSVTVMLPFQPPHSQIETFSFLGVQFPNFLEGLFCIFCNSSVYSLSSGWGDQAHRAVLHMWVPQGFQDHAQHPLSCSHHPDDGNIGGFLAAAANRKDLRISTNSSLKSLSPHCTCQLWILFHAITVWLFPATQTFNHTYSYSEASRSHQHQYHYLKTTEHHSKTWKLLCAFLTPQHKGNAE